MYCWCQEKIQMAIAAKRGLLLTCFSLPRFDESLSLFHYPKWVNFHFNAYIQLAWRPCHRLKSVSLFFSLVNPIYSINVLGLSIISKNLMVSSILKIVTSCRSVILPSKHGRILLFPASAYHCLLSCWVDPTH